MFDFDWCPECGEPRKIADIHPETQVDNINGTGPEWVAVDLECGHSVGSPTGRAS